MLSVFMLNVIMLSIFMLNAFMLNVVMLSVEAPFIMVDNFSLVYSLSVRFTLVYSN
jgi:hypothetical protein